jgi:murein DD-endopeptidase MepM/ murein hydrolase activator NlpD
MNIIFVPKRVGRTGTYRLKSTAIYSLIAVFVALPVGLGVGGYMLGKQDSELGPVALVEGFQQELAKQRQEIARAHRMTSDTMDALAMRLGKLQAHVIRVDALGERLTEMAQIESGEFDFSALPAQGGPETRKQGEGEPVSVPEFTIALNELSSQLDDRAQQLGLLETMMMSRSLQDEVVPAGRPIGKGWLSSYYGMRTDPFTGRKEMHKGMDFAGKKGSDVISVAAGVITWAGRRYGYGNLVEVNHGNGYSTRYGHNEKIVVKVGQTIKKGDIISKMGSTGRSTGPHVHFEVLKEGKQVDPIKYINAAKAGSASS